MSSSDQAKEIFLDALEQADAERDAFVRRACAGNVDLERQVRALLDAHLEAGTFLSTPTLSLHSAGAPTPAGAAAEDVGTQVGNYRLLEAIGEGGFGVVYRAEQIEPIRRVVAIKIIKPGMDSRQVVARFEAERQVLAIMEHPHIAKLFDAGTFEEGRPYFVMEFVDGVPITRFCHEHRYSIRERLGVFTTVCHAIQHAHRKGIIHRDIKPNNVLIGGTRDHPVPKIIDFGVAKAMSQPSTDGTAFTAHHQLIGTPQYMSPEQAELSSSDVDTRSDVYALGVLLYELLTGSTPIEGTRLRRATLSEIQRMICQEVPAKPSSRIATAAPCEPHPRHSGVADPKRTSRRLRGDLDVIVLKALHKDRERRYASVERLADDVHRHLEDLPISARADSLAYRTARWARRHRTVAVASVLVVVSIVVGFGMTIRQVRIAADQRDVAMENLRQAYLAQARAARSSKRPGRRVESLAALARAAQIRPTREWRLRLRNEAIACMTLSDLWIDRSIGTYHASSMRGLERPDRFAFSPKEGETAFVRTDDPNSVTRLPSPAGAWEAYHALFSRDGRFFITLFRLRNGRPVTYVWDTARGRRVIELPSDELAAGMAFHPNNQWVALSFRNKTVNLYDLPSGTLIRSLPSSGVVTALAVDPTGRKLAVAGINDRRVAIIDTETGEPGGEFPISAGIDALSWSPNGSRLAGGSSDYTIYVWDTETKAAPIALTGHQADVRGVFWHSNNHTLASYGWDNTSRIWDLRFREQLFEPLRSWIVFGLGPAFAAANRSGELAIWRLEPPRVLRRLHAPQRRGPTESVQVSPDGRWILTAGTDGVALWDAERAAFVSSLSHRLSIRARFLENGHAIVATDSQGLKRWTLDSAQGAPVVSPPEVVWRVDGLKGFDVSGDERSLFLRQGSRIVEFDLHRREVRRVLDGYPRINVPTVSRDGKWMFTGTWKGHPGRLWNLEDGSQLRRFPGANVLGRFSPDSAWLAVSRGADIVFYDTQRWTEHLRIDRTAVRDDVAGEIAFHPNGQVVAVGRSRFEIELLEFPAGRSLATLADPKLYAIRDLDFSRDGRMLVVATPDRVLLRWDLDKIRARLRAISLDWP